VSTLGPTGFSGLATGWLGVVVCSIFKTVGACWVC
jgi:hypothetical protein